MMECPAWQDVFAGTDGDSAGVGFSEDVSCILSARGGVDLGLGKLRIFLLFPYQVCSRMISFTPGLSLFGYFVAFLLALRIFCHSLAEM